MGFWLPEKLRGLRVLECLESVEPWLASDLWEYGRGMCLVDATRPGKPTKSYWKWLFIVSFPINSMVIFHSYVSLPEGNRLDRFDVALLFY